MNSIEYIDNLIEIRKNGRDSALKIVNQYKKSDDEIFKKVCENFQKLVNEDEEKIKILKEIKDKLVNLNKPKENEIILNEEFKTIYNVDVCESKWQIDLCLSNGNVKIEDLNELLVNDDKLDEFYYCRNSWDKIKAYEINEIIASYEIKKRNEKMWIYIYSDEDTYEMRCKPLYSDCNFETYEEALKYGREESRKVIEEVLEYNKEKK